MPIPPRFAAKLQETFGIEATEDFVNWTGEIDDLRGDVAELRHEMQLGFVRVDARIDQIEVRLSAKIDQTTTKLGALIDKRVADLMKWSFVFWVGAVGAIAALAGVLR